MTIQATQPPNPRVTVRPYRLTVRQFLKAVKVGMFPHGVRLELLGGIPVQKVTTDPPHHSTVYRLGFALRGLLPAGWLLFEEKPIDVGRRWRPVPDPAVTRGPIDRFLRDDPNTTDVALMIEVSDTTHGKDRGIKWRGHAAAGLSPYWIVNLESAQVEACSDSTGRGTSARYRSETVFKKGDTIPVVLGGVEVGRIGVDDFMP